MLTGVPCWVLPFHPALLVGTILPTLQKRKWLQRGDMTHPSSLSQGLPRIKTGLNPFPGCPLPQFPVPERGWARGQGSFHLNTGQGDSQPPAPG